MTSALAVASTWEGWPVSEPPVIECAGADAEACSTLEQLISWRREKTTYLMEYRVAASFYCPSSAGDITVFDDPHSLILWDRSFMQDLLDKYPEAFTDIYGMPFTKNDVERIADATKVFVRNSEAAFDILQRLVKEDEMRIQRSVKGSDRFDVLTPVDGAWVWRKNKI